MIDAKNTDNGVIVTYIHQGHPYRGRAWLLGTTFETHEHMIREQLQEMLGSTGFDHQRDIAGITVNRWAHGYAYYASSLFDDMDKVGELSPSG